MTTESVETEEIINDQNAIETRSSNVVATHSQFQFSRMFIIKMLLSAVILVTAFRFFEFHLNNLAPTKAQGVIMKKAAIPD